MAETALPTLGFLALLDVVGGVQMATHPWSELLGGEDPDLRSFVANGTLHPDDVPATGEALRCATHNPGQVVPLANRWLGADGVYHDLFWVLCARAADGPVIAATPTGTWPSRPAASSSVLEAAEFSLRNAADLRGVLEALVAHACELLDCTEASAALGDEVVHLASYGLRPPPSALPVPRQRPAEGAPMRAAISTSVLGHGVLEVRRPRIGSFTAAQHTLLSELAERASRSAEALSEAREAGSQDPLTGMLDRAALQRKVDVGFAADDLMIVLGLSGFDEVNAAFGRVAGEEVLTALAGRLEHAYGDQANMLARIGDEAFAIWVRGAGRNSAMAARQLSAALEAMDVPVDTMSGVPVYLRGQLGTATADGADRPGTTVLEHAEAAMYRAGVERVPWRAFDPARDSGGRERLRLAAELHSALLAGEVVPYFQPVVDLRTGRTRSWEALARWEHPTRGLVPPAEFIGLAESFGLIQDVTFAVLRGVVAQVDHWQARGIRLPCAVNLSACCLEPPAAVGGLLELLGQRSDVITFEITESALASAAVVRALEGLRDGGFRIAIDDFGTGYSSLGALRELPVSTIKIDRCFVTDVAEDEAALAVVKTVIGLAEALGLDVIVEGIETPDQARLLTEVGAVMAQGFLYSAPLPAGDLQAWMQRQRWGTVTPRSVAKPSDGAASSGSLAGFDLGGDLEVEGVREHEVLLYRDQPELMGELLPHVRRALAGHGHAVFMDTPETRSALLSAISGRQLRRAQDDGRLLVLDAEWTLSTFVRDGLPDPALFNLHVADLLRARLRAGKRLTAYDEMVALLWRRGEIAAALRLEQLWNDLQRSEAFALLCAYPLGDVRARRGLAEVCEQHTVTRMSRRLEPDAAPTHGTTGPREISGSRASTTPGWPKVLMVEDDVQNLALMSYLLRTSGIGCLEARDGREGVAVARAEHPDLVLMDLRMPHLDGFGALRELRAGSDTSDIPVVAVTARTLDLSDERALEAGFNGLLPKPLDPGTFVDKVLAHAAA